MGLILVDFNRVFAETEQAAAASPSLEEKKRVKPLQIALLVVAGAAGGAIVMKMAERPQPATNVAQGPAAMQSAPAQSTQVPPPSEAPAAAPAPSRVHEGKPAPFPKPLPVSRALPVHQPEPSASEPAAPASSQQPVAVAPSLQGSPEPVAPAPPEPENVSPALIPPPPPPAPHQVTLNAGALLPVRLIEGLSTERNNPGDMFTGTLEQPLIADGWVIAERGARVEGRVVSADKGGKISGVATITVELTRVHLSDGQTLSIRTENFAKRAEATHGRDAAKIGAGAAIGAAIGAIAGGGKGAAIGAGAGGAAGTADVLLTRGHAATLPSETHISFRLSVSVTVTEQGA